MRQNKKESIVGLKSLRRHWGMDACHVGMLGQYGDYQRNRKVGASRRGLRRWRGQINSDGRRLDFGWCSQYNIQMIYHRVVYLKTI